MQTEHVMEIVRHIQKKANCQVEMGPAHGGPTARLRFNDLPANSDYLISFFDADNAGTLGVKIRWTLGEVSDFKEVWKCLVLNEKKLLDQGPLFAAIIPRNDVGLFSLVGQMIFSPGTPAEEIATLWLNQAFLNYVMFEIVAPGVQMY